MIGDFRTMHFEDVDEILSEHLLEHFGRDEGIQVLKLWYDWLKPGGTLIVETPDVEGVAENFGRNKYWMTRHLYGSQETDWAFHRDGWYESKFRDIFGEMGFEIVSITKNVTRGILPNIRVTATKK